MRCRRRFLSRTGTARATRLAFGVSWSPDDDTPAPCRSATVGHALPCVTYALTSFLSDQRWTGLTGSTGSERGIFVARSLSIMLILSRMALEEKEGTRLRFIDWPACEDDRELVSRISRVPVSFPSRPATTCWTGFGDRGNPQRRLAHEALCAVKVLARGASQDWSFRSN